MSSKSADFLQGWLLHHNCIHCLVLPEFNQKLKYALLEKISTIGSKMVLFFGMSIGKETREVMLENKGSVAVEPSVFSSEVTTREKKTPKKLR